MKKIVVAVSGGVDSVVLLDFLVRFFRNKNGQKWLEENLIVAHFEHGIRGKESQEDCEFVRRLAEKDRLKFEFEHGNLGENSSEEKARNARYIFLRKIAKRENAIIFTAHHKNDLAETFALNLVRGGGWRAVACFYSPDIERPFLQFSKLEILKMAKRQDLVWREDSTNFSQKYTRNRIRKTLNFSEKDLEFIFKIWQRQIELRREIEKVTQGILFEIGDGQKFEREFFCTNSDEVCYEILREIMIYQSGKIPLSKQIWNLLRAIRTFKNGSKTQILGGCEVIFSRNHWSFIPTIVSR